MKASMAMVLDLTPEFLKAVRATAVANGYDEVIVKVFIVRILGLCPPWRGLFPIVKRLKLVSSLVV